MKAEELWVIGGPSKGGKKAGDKEEADEGDDEPKVNPSGDAKKVAVAEIASALGLPPDKRAALMSGLEAFVRACRAEGDDDSGW